MHDLGSLRTTWDEFNTLSLALRDHPSVITCKGDPDSEAIRDIVYSREFVNTEKLAKYAESALTSTRRNESLDLKFEVIASQSDNLGPNALAVPGEEEYYGQINDDLMGRIIRELESGQTPGSRRFVTANSSCISYVRFIHRPEHDILDVMCRSTNIPKNLKIDLDALVHIGFKAQSLIGTNQRDIKMRVNLNCAHIIP
jgi:hypothetical protein